MGCAKSRIGPMPISSTIAIERSDRRKESRPNGKARRRIRFRAVKVTPAKSHLGGGDNPEYVDKLKVDVSVRPNSRMESSLFTSNRPEDATIYPDTCNVPRPSDLHPTLSKAERGQIQADILHELRVAGILEWRASASGAISFTVADKVGSGGAPQPSHRPPARLISLKKNLNHSMQERMTADKLKKRMEAAEKRRKLNQDALKERLRVHSRLGMQYSEAAAQAERALQQRVADKIIEKELAYNKRVEQMRKERRERVQAMSRRGDHAKQVVESLDKACQKRAADNVAKKTEPLLDKRHTSGTPTCKQSVAEPKAPRERPGSSGAPPS
ncbi:uncharacterized protein LOC110987151 [Acanthaster planci]|uniref:Uncharacterized protein LOC110987151 n=1 Tax=Acanthaster planci TaxID=133434 RepID=A0A8B7ZJW2_ACAPL|nr:uncharacterized protein LOC110987151 [Acanthaster planci]